MLKRSLLAASLGLAVLALVPTAQAQSRNSIEIRQSGYANELAARVDGHRNRLSLEQRGVRQFISTLQDGTRNGAQVSQTGSDNQAVSWSDSEHRSGYKKLYTFENGL